MNRQARNPYWRGWLLVAATLWMTVAPAVHAAGLPRLFAEPASVGGEESSAGPGLHIYLYANGNPLAGLDPTGLFTLNEEIPTVSAVSNVGRLAYPTVAAAPAAAATIYITIGFEAGLTVATLGPILDAARRTAKFQEARKSLKEKLETEEKRRGKRILFYYRDPGRVIFIAATGLLPTTKANGIGFPQGAYATDVSPADSRFTQKQLAAAFFGDYFANYGTNPSVSYFVAFFADIFWKPLSSRLHPDVPHWQKDGPFPGSVPIDVIAAGPNLMAP